MRHKRKGRHLGRTASHRKALLRNLACSLFLTERDPDFYEGMKQADGKTDVNPPRFRGRLVTTIQKAKEVRPLVEKCITLAKKALPHLEQARQFATDSDRNTDDWQSWRTSERWKQWVAARAPYVATRRRLFSILRDKDAVAILFDEIAPRFSSRDGGYTRIMRLAKPRLGDAGTRAILELVDDKVRPKRRKAERPEYVAESAIETE
jgi:large subunit ribosomal protein L17